MKAKTYYMLSSDSPRLALRLIAPNHPKWRKAAHGGFDVPVKVIKSSDVEKLVEKAAKGAYVSFRRKVRDHARKMGLNAIGDPALWKGASEANRDEFRMYARAVFKAIGLLP